MNFWDSELFCRIVFSIFYIKLTADMRLLFALNLLVVSLLRGIILFSRSKNCFRRISCIRKVLICAESGCWLCLLSDKLGVINVYWTTPPLECFKFFSLSVRSNIILLLCLFEGRPPYSVAAWWLLFLTVIFLRSSSCFCFLPTCSCKFSTVLDCILCCSIELFLYAIERFTGWLRISLTF